MGRTTEQFKPIIDKALEACGPNFPPSRLMDDRISADRGWETIGSFAASRQQRFADVLEYNCRFDITPLLKLLIKVEDKDIRESILAEVMKLESQCKHLKDHLDEAQKSFDTIEVEYWQAVREYLEANKLQEKETSGEEEPETQ